MNSKSIFFAGIFVADIERGQESLHWKFGTKSRRWCASKISCVQRLIFTISQIYIFQNTFLVIKIIYFFPQKYSTNTYQSTPSHR